MKALYEVTATKNRRVKAANGFITTDDGYIAHHSYQIASSVNEAIELAKLYIPNSVEYDLIRATYIRDE